MSEIKRLRKMADKIYAKMENMQRLTDSELKGKGLKSKKKLLHMQPLHIRISLTNTIRNAE